MSFLPVNQADLAARGLTSLDFVVVSGDVDHEWNGVHRVDVERIMKQ